MVRTGEGTAGADGADGRGNAGTRHNAGRVGGALGGRYAVMRVAKLKTRGEIGALGKHNERDRETRNADAARLGDNERLAGTGDWCADVERRLADARYRRPDAVLGLEHILTASKDFFADGDPGRLATWHDAAMAWLRATYGEKNVVAAVLHRDEITPHIQAVVVPLDARDHLNAKHWTGGREKLSALQDSYARAMEPFGLVRGVRGSVAAHQTVKEFYAKIETPTPATDVVREQLAVDKPGRIVTNPDRWASEQQERIVERIAPTLDAALVKAQHYEEQAAKAEANIVVLQQRVRQVEQERDALQRDYRAMTAQLRAVDLPTVIERLGGEQDKHDRHKWRIDGEHVSMTNGVFYNHDRQSGGGGAIDLVQHLTGYDFKDAVAYLRDQHGGEAAVTAATWHAARAGQVQAQDIVDHAERPAFRAPTPDETRWSGVRTYLVEQRALPAGLVDDVHQRGIVYADSRSNAVFLRQDADGNADGNATGASLRGTLPGSEFKGLAAGTRRDEGHFAFTVGKPEMHAAPQVYVVESPIDGLSRAALLRAAGDRHEMTFASTDGHGELPRRQIDEGLARHALVHCSFDNDAGGTTLWKRVQEAYPRAAAIVRDRPPAGCKDWNDAQRQPTQRQERPEKPSHQREHAPSHGQGVGRPPSRDERDDRRL